MAINIKPSRKGLLHKKLGVPQGQKIPVAKVKAALNSPSPALRKEANFAKNARSFKHVGGNNDNYSTKNVQARHQAGPAGHFSYKG